MAQQKTTIAEQISYDPITGKFSWLISKSGVPEIGMEAGSLNKEGYRYIKINNRQYKANRLAFYLMTGEWPKARMDHKNRIKSDDRWDNLREATQSQNTINKPKNKNNSSGFKGVSSCRGRFQARLCKDGNSHHLGMFDTPEEAAIAYDKMAIEMYGEFAYLNFGGR